MADVSAPEIAQAYQDVRNDKLPLNWMFLSYENDRSDILKLSASGDGGLEELKEKLADKDADAGFGYVRVSYANDKESTREKFVLITWIGKDVKVMRKAKVSVHTADVKQVLSAYSVDVAARDLEDLDEGHIVIKLRKAGGASYDRV
ncbi:hypothetical protein FRC03_008012 [Tulasnella sp. 419]|nr:hypothetical protein FRC02_007591 [Tulasnella sp. 418]KAG8959412.1 hypothetical protein FRC03_008012 [Tulasnella sp. 419]